MDMTLPGGTRVTTYHPPPGFDPLSASNAERQKAGFPPRPDDPRLQARYDHVLTRLKGKLNYVPPTLRRNAEVFHGPRRQQAQAGAEAQAGTETSTNWSGAAVFAPTGKPFSWIQGDWVIPDVDAPTQNQWSYCATWIGIDGDGSGDVCQIGFECEVYRSGSSIVRNVYPWWEWFPESEVAITNFSASPGDMVTALLCTSGGGATSASAYFTNRTTGATTSLSFSAPAGTSLVGNSAEWVVEAPTVGGQQSSVADYGEVFFSECTAFAGTIAGGGTAVGGGTGDSITMDDAAGNPVSVCNLITPTIVRCEYVGTLP